VGTANWMVPIMRRSGWYHVSGTYQIVDKYGLHIEMAPIFRQGTIYKVPRIIWYLVADPSRVLRRSAPLFVQGTTWLQSSLRNCA
jgi:hypothetical protein